MVRVTSRNRVIPPRGRIFVPSPGEANRAFGNFVSVLSEKVSGSRPTFVRYYGTLMVSPSSSCNSGLSGKLKCSVR